MWGAVSGNTMMMKARINSPEYSAAVKFPRPSPNFLAYPRPRHVGLSYSRKKYCCSAVAFDIKSSKGMQGFHEFELEVRDYELDQYGVVNNAVYSSYCQYGHHQVLKKYGVNSDEVVRNGGALALSELTLKFLAPLRSGDRFVVKVRVSDSSAARLFFQHYIYKIPSLEPVVEARAIVVMLNKNYIPVRIPAEVRSKLLHFHPNHEEKTKVIDRCK